MPRRTTAKRAKLLAELDRQNRRTGSAGAMHARAIAERVGVNATDFECMDILDWTGPITAGELARRAGITSGAVTGVIDRLERGGWVRRVADPNDRRKVIVELVQPTADGASHEKYQDLFRMLTTLQDEIVTALDDFDDDEIARLVEYLERANDAVERSIERLRQRD
jgi:DNA-binding MarR family transcriptional regulator